MVCHASMRGLILVITVVGFLSVVVAPCLGFTFWAIYGKSGFLGGSSIAETADGGVFLFHTDPVDVWVIRLDGSGGLGGTCSRISLQSTLQAASALSKAADGLLAAANSSATVTSTTAIVQATAAMTQSCHYNGNAERTVSLLVSLLFF